jgi:hypothetical protein
MIDQQFTQLLQNHTDALADRKRFAGLLKDLMPGMALQTNLLLNLYDIGFHEEIEKAAEITDLFAFRFVKQLCDEYGVNKPGAEWAVSLWCKCYGQIILAKSYDVTIYVASPNIASEQSSFAESVEDAGNKETEFICDRGEFVGGEDIPAGRYDIFWVSGEGAISSAFRKDDGIWYCGDIYEKMSEEGGKVYRNAKLLNNIQLEVKGTLIVKLVKKSDIT